LRILYHLISARVKCQTSPSLPVDDDLVEVEPLVLLRAGFAADDEIAELRVLLLKVDAAALALQLLLVEQRPLLAVDGTDC